MFLHLVKIFLGKGMDIGNSQAIRKLFVFLVIASAATGLYVTNLYHYLLFHNLAELFSIVIAFGIFVTAWNSREFLSNGFLLFIGIAYLFIGGLDVVHTLAFKGMPIFPEYGTNLATQLWIAARYMEALTFLVATLFLHREVNAGIIFLVYTSITVFLFLSIFQWDVFPACFIEGTGLTPFKKMSEYVISLILLGAVVLLVRHRDFFDKDVLVWLLFSILLTIVSELFLMLYTEPHGFYNFIGHLAKISSFFCIYKAVIETGFSKPYTLIFRQLKTSKERYHSLFQNMMDGFVHNKVIFDEDGNPTDFIFLEVNDSFQRIVGLKREDLIGKLVSSAIPEISDSTADWIGKYAEVFATGRPIRFEHYSEMLKKWLLITAYCPEEGHFVAIFEDITLRKSAEERLQKSKDDLERIVQERTMDLRDYAARLEWKNRELQEFAYVASHDLQEPLRKIQMFGSLLEREEGDKLVGKSSDYLNRMTRAALRMSTLIHDLLVYSRVSTKSNPFSRVNLNEALRRALENLEASTRQSGATIITEELPSIDADMVQMTQLFQNLVANALKFTQNSKEPRVEVSYSTLSGTEEVRNQYCEIRIKDNGIGFDEKYLDKIFQPFERLKQKGVEHEGTGIGLAICRRIVERHGGRITARSTPDEGSTFIVTLPFFQGGVSGHE